MLYVSEVESNCKGGVACRLGPRTLVVGPTATGKTALLNALELATTGRASDVRGRVEVAKEIELLALAPGRTGELYSRVRISDTAAPGAAGGTEAVWRMGSKGGKSRRAVHQLPPTIDKDSVLALRPVREAILGSVETARKFFLQFAVGAVTDQDVLSRIPAALHAYYRRAVLNAGLAETSVDKLLMALEKAKKEGRSANDRAKAAKAAAADAAQGLAPMPTAEMLSALKTARKEAQQRLDVLHAAKAAADALDPTRTQLAALGADVDAATVAVAAANASAAVAEEALGKLPVPITLDANLQAIRTAIDWHVQTAVALPPPGLLACLVCGREADPAAFAARQEAARAFAAKVEAEAKAYADARAHRDAVNMSLTSAREKLSALTSQQAALSAAVAQAAQGGGPDPAALEAAAAAVATLDEQLRNAEVLQATWSASRRAQDNALEAEGDAREWERLADACTDAVTRLLDAGVAGFQARVQAFMPGSRQFALMLRDGVRQVFDFGIVRAGVVYTALSGAEWAVVTAAIAGACHAPGKLSIVIPEERAVDPKILTEAMVALGQIDAQVVLTSTIYPVAVPDTWTVIDTSKDQHRAGAAAPSASPTALSW